MRSDDIVADLHLHTTASDGTVSVDHRLTQAKQTGLKAVAITDHDTIAAELRLRRQRRDGVELITGVELKAAVMGEKIELLGYYIDPSDEQLSELLDQARAYRRNRNDRLLNKLSDATGLDLSRADIPSPRGALGRPHIAKALVEADIVSSIQAAFDDYLAAGEACCVPMERADYDTAIHAIQRAGGVASLAHPGRITADTRTVETLVVRLTEAGLNALEVEYPYTGGESRCADITVSDAAEMAGANELLRTSGSDCHGPDSGKFRFGTVGVSDTELTALRTRATDRRPFSSD